MAIASRVKWFLEVNRMRYETLMHRYAETSRDTAEAARVPRGKLAKGVLLEDEHGFVMPIIPADARVDIEKVNALFHRTLRLATEQDAESLFFDCEDGAVPPMGAAYGIPTVIDDRLLDLADVYFEAGTHVDLVHMDGADFFSLIPDANHADLTGR